jgi:glucokinase
MAHKSAYAGIDIGGTNIKFGLVDVSGNIIYKEQRPTMASKGAEPLMHLVTNIAEGLLYHAAEEDVEVQWLGVGTPGAVDAKTGTVIGLSPNIVGWQGTPIGKGLRDRLNLPVWVDNDANCTALAEARFGAGVGYKSIICVTIGTGVGGGIVLDGKLWRGANHAAGEIGHVSINFEGPLCRCGARGCVEAYCSSEAIIARTKGYLSIGMTTAFEEVLEGDLDNLKIKKLFAAVKMGDEVALRVIDETAELLATGLAGVVNLINPEIVLIGGGVADGGGGLVEAVSAAVRKRAFEVATERLRIARATLGNNAGFIGAGLRGVDK